MLEIGWDHVAHTGQMLKSDCIHVVGYSLQIKVKKLSLCWRSLRGWSIVTCEFFHLGSQRLLLGAIRLVLNWLAYFSQVCLGRGKILGGLSLLRTVLGNTDEWFGRWLVPMVIKSGLQEILLLSFLVV
jgi:hypothetical protein